MLDSVAVQVVALLRTLRRNPLFGRLFAGLLASRAGDALFVVAVSWAALDLAGPAQLGLVLLLGGLPAALASPVAGHLLDRFGLRTPLLVDNLVRAGVLVALALLAASGRLGIGHLYVAAVVLGLTATATEIGQGVAVPEVVPEHDLAAANTLVSVIWDLAAWVGPLLGGVVVQVAGTAAAFAADAATFLVMAWAVLPLRRGPAAGGDDVPAGDRPGLLARIGDGFATALRLPAVPALVALSAGVLVLGGAMEVFLPTYTREQLHASPATFGLLASVLGAASLAGTVLLAPRLGAVAPRRALVFLLVAKGVAMLPLALLASPVAAAAVLGVVGMLDGPFYPVSRTLLQQRVPAALRGRVLGSIGAVTAGAFPLGSALAGGALTALGAAGTAVLLAAAHLPLAALAALTRGFDARPRT